MVEIGGRPILWHIMKIYSHWGVNDFIVCLGYRGYVVKEYFANFHLHSSDVRFNLATGEAEIMRAKGEPWKVTLVDTGETSMTGGRLQRVLPFVEAEKSFCMTYGDGVGDVNVPRLIAFHDAHGKRATVTAVPPPRRFGQLEVTGDRVASFVEKPAGDGGLINGGFFVLSPEVAGYLEGDQTIWEQKPLQRLAAEGQLHAYRHEGFWQPMDTLRDRTELEDLWATGKAPWKLWA
jgi:glucose-1-phosphate cytidylyltransferase